MGEFSEENAVLKNWFFEQIQGKYKDAFEAIGKYRWPGDKGKDGYWVHRYIDEVERLSKAFFATKKEIIDRYAEKDDEGKNKTDESGQGILISRKNNDAFTEEFESVMDIDVEMNLKKRIFNLDGKPFTELSPEEWKIIWPYVGNKIEE